MFYFAKFYYSGSGSGRVVYKNLCSWYRTTMKVFLLKEFPEVLGHLRKCRNRNGRRNGVESVFDPKSIYGKINT